MKVLFISRAKANNHISPVVQAQANSLPDGVDLSIFTFTGRGWKTYFRNIFKIKKYLLTHDVDVIHAHYSYVGMVTSLATRKPIVVSLMGSDVEDYRIGRWLIRFFNKTSWKAVIVKSQRLKNKIRIKDAYVIPNGVNMDVFKPRDQIKSAEIIEYNPLIKYVLFLSDKARPEKNYPLAENACALLKKEYYLNLAAIHDVEQKEIPNYLAASSVILLTSIFEGSPNVIKEAMACNCPIVSTDVGDVKEVIANTEGCYITSYDPEDVAEKLKMAIEFGKRTNGREKIQHLDDKIIAERLIEVYHSVLK